MRTNLILNFLVFLGFLVQAQNPIDFSIPKTKIYHKRYINYTSTVPLDLKITVKLGSL